MMFRDDAQTVVTVFDAFGWEITPEFRHRYWTDALIYNMANAMVQLHTRVKELEGQSTTAGVSDGRD